MIRCEVSEGLTHGCPLPPDTRDDARPSIDAPNALIDVVYDEEVPLSVERDSCRCIQHRLSRWPTIASKARPTGTGDGGYDLALEIDFPHPVVVGICDVELSCWAHCNGCGVGQHRARCLAAVSPESRRAGSCKCCNDAGSSIDLSDTVVPRISDENIAVLADGHCVGIETRARRKPVITTEAPCSISRYGPALPVGGIYLIDPVRASVDDEDTPVSLQCDPGRSYQIESGGHLSLCPGVFLAYSSRDDARRHIHASHAMIKRVSNEQIPLTIQGQAPGRVQVRVGPNSSISAKPSSTVSSTGTSPKRGTR